jgi:cell division septation protein DedD
VRCGSPAIGRSLLALATLVVAGAAGLLGVQRAAPASAATSCVAVIVDFRQLGGAVQTGCAQGDPTSGFQALSKAGFGYTSRPRDGLVCQINGTPACTDTTSSTYWSYWYRAPGSSSWVYANQGPGSHNPKPGSSEAWVWQDGGRTRPPGIAASTVCPQLKATANPTPTATHTRAPPTRGTSTPTRARTTSPASPARNPEATPSTAPTRSRTSSPPTATTGAATSNRSPIASAASSTSAAAVPGGGGAGSTDGSDGSGGPLPGAAGIALGGALVVGIGTAAVLRSRRSHTS